MSHFKSPDRSIVIAEGIDALRRLYDMAAHHDNGGARRVAAFLLGLYNGMRFPFDLTDLRMLDNAVFADCMLVLRMDARVCEREIHNYIDDGGKRFEAMAEYHGIEDIMKLRRASSTGAA